MAEKKKIAFVTLGCKLNYAETSTYERGFAEAGLEIVPWEEEADLYLVNTCTVTEHSDKKCRNIIRKLHRVSPGAGIIVTGCYAELKKAEIEKIEGVEFVFGAQQKKEVVPTVLQHISGGSSRAKEQVHVDECSIRHTKACDTGAQSFLPAYSSGERTRSFLKVQYGCDYLC